MKDSPLQFLTDPQATTFMYTPSVVKGPMSTIDGDKDSPPDVSLGKDHVNKPSGDHKKTKFDPKGTYVEGQDPMAIDVIAKSSNPTAMQVARYGSWLAGDCQIHAEYHNEFAEVARTKGAIAFLFEHAQEAACGIDPNAIFDKLADGLKNLNDKRLSLFSKGQAAQVRGDLKAAMTYFKQAAALTGRLVNAEDQARHIAMLVKESQISVAEKGVKIARIVRDTCIALEVSLATGGAASAIGGTVAAGAGLTGTAATVGSFASGTVIVAAGRGTVEGAVSYAKGDGFLSGFKEGVVGTTVDQVTGLGMSKATKLYMGVKGAEHLETQLVKKTVVDYVADKTVIEPFLKAEE